MGAPPGVSHDPRLLPLPRVGIRVGARVRRTEGQSSFTVRARPGVNRQSPGPHIRQPDPRSLPAGHRAAGRSRLPPAHPLPRVLHFITTANAHMNFGQSQFTTTPLPRWKNLTTGRTSSRLSPSPSSAQSVPNHRPLAPTSTQLYSPLQTIQRSQTTCSSSDTATVPFRQVNTHRPLAPAPTRPQSPSDKSTHTDRLLQLRHNHSPLQTIQRSQATLPQLRHHNTPLETSSHSGPPQIQQIADTIRVTPPEPRPLLRRLLVVAT